MLESHASTLEKVSAPEMYLRKLLTEESLI